MSTPDTRLINSVHPIDCGCTDCLVGSSVPLDRATFDQVVAMLNRQVHDSSGVDYFDVTWRTATANLDGAPTITQVQHGTYIWLP